MAWSDPEVGRRWKKSYMLRYNASHSGRAAKRRHAKTAKAKRTVRVYRRANKERYALLASDRQARLKKYTPIDRDTIRPPLRPGHCDHCGNRRRLCMDHDHKTGRYRGRLCNRCNTAFGTFGDTVDGLEKAIAYLKNN